MEKFMMSAVDMVSEFMPRWKTKMVGMVSIAMMVCQMMGYHMFSMAEWSALGMGGMTTMAMRSARNAKGMK